MPKDYARFVPPKSRTSHKKKRRLNILYPIFLLIFLSLTAGGYVYYNKTPKPIFAENTAVSIWFTKLTVFFHSSKTRQPKFDAKINSKKIPPTKVTPTIAFNFYDELPNMQMAVAANIVTAERTTSPKLIAAKLVKLPAPTLVQKPVSASTNVVASSTRPQPDADRPSRLDKKPTLIDANEISHLLTAENVKPIPLSADSQQYLLQLGIFETAKAAGLFREALGSVGFTTKIVMIQKDNHHYYRVQQGPFENMHTAQENQLHLQRRGIVSIIRKLA